MHTIILLNVFVFVATTLLTFPPSADAVCCHLPASKRCSDCSYQPKHCGLGTCNIFGCQCDAGCRTGSCGELKTKRSSDDEDIQDAFDDILLIFGDYNEDGLLSVEEAETMLMSTGLEYLDIDKDGFLSNEEMDAYQP